MQKNIIGKPFTKGYIPWNKGLKTGLQHDGQFKVGMTAWNKGKLVGNHGNGYKEGGLGPNKGKIFSASHRANISKALTGRRLSPQHVKNALRRREMSSLEIKFQQIIDEYQLPYKFVGNGEFMIENKNPDFININGEKKAIEVYYKRHKEEFRNGIQAWKEDRASIFAKYGWELLFLEATDLNNKTIINKILRGGDSR